MATFLLHEATPHGPTRREKAWQSGNLALIEPITQDAAPAAGPPKGTRLTRLLSIAVLSLLAGPVLAQPAPAPPRPEARPEVRQDTATPAPDRSTEHTLSLPGRAPLRFTATVSTVRLSNDAGAAQADLVLTSFVAPGTGRPVTFAVNGGPGASSAWLNLGALGPWRLPIGDAAPSPALPPVLVDNAETWLPFTDLVFIDPAGTGYSRVLGGDDARRRLFSVDGDVSSIAEAIRRWLESNNRLASPKFIAGESYGGFRGPRLARALRGEQGVGVAGLVLVSPVLDFGGRQNELDPLNWVARLPSMAAAAGAAPDRATLREAEEYAAGDYLLDLVRGESDRAAVARASERVAALTGLDPALVRRRAGRVDLNTFLRERGSHAPGEPPRIASAYDATITIPDPFPAAANDNAPDPVLTGLRAPMTSAAIALYASRLNWRPEAGRRYEILSDSVNRAWDYGRGGRPESVGSLRVSMALDPAFRVLVVHGLYDLVTPYFASKLLLDQLPPLGPDGQVRLRAYPGGHMFYSRDASRAAFTADAEALIGAAPGTPPPPATPAPATGTPAAPATR